MLNDALTLLEKLLPLKEVLGRMLAHLPDGHIELLDTQSMWLRFPIKLEEVDGRVFIIESAMPRLRYGDEVIAVEGEPVRIRLDRLYASKSGTDHWRRSRTLDELRIATGNLLTLTIERDGVEQTLTLNIDDQNEGVASQSSFNKMEGEYYFLDHTKNFKFTEEVAHIISESEGLVNDLRGYDLTPRFPFRPETELSSVWTWIRFGFAPITLNDGLAVGLYPKQQNRL